MDAPIHGRLANGAAAPRSGELIGQLAEMSGVIIEQIVSGEIDAPVDYDQDHDEWVLLLEGAAELEVNGEKLSLETGDWVLLPRHTPHRLIRTAPGSNWIAVHMPGH
jgi:cupin 2 domain-containing protein